MVTPKGTLKMIYQVIFPLKLRNLQMNAIQEKKKEESKRKKN